MDTWNFAAQSLDDALLSRGLSDAELKRLADWCVVGEGARYLEDIGRHDVVIKPSSWAKIEPWPTALADRSTSGTCRLSSADLFRLAAGCAESGEWSQLLVASYVWGQGTTGYGPTRLRKILSMSSVKAALRTGVEAVEHEGAREGYRVFHGGAVRGFGPAFFTKFLYFAFAGPASRRAGDPMPLILDRRVARSIRAIAEVTAVDQELVSSPGEAGRLSRWQWSDSGWSSARYGVYLRWAHRVAEQLTEHRRSDGHVDPVRPDLIELALFLGVVTPDRWPGKV